MDYDTFKQIKDNTFKALKIEFIILVFETEWISLMAWELCETIKVNLIQQVLFLNFLWA